MSQLATIELGQAGLEGLRWKVEKLNKRAKRHGMNELVVTVLEEKAVLNEITGIEDPFYWVEITGSAPCINGWNLAAKIENNEVIGTVVRVIPGDYADQDYSAYRNHDFGCDHCNTRRRRNDVFVLIDCNGQHKVVGRNCLADFLRCENAEDFARYAEFCDSVGRYTDADLTEYAYEEGFGGRGGRPVTALDRFLAVVSVCTRRLGWTGRGAAYDNPEITATADYAYYVLYGCGKAHRAFVEHNKLCADANDYDSANCAIEWAKSIEPGKSEYLETIHKIATAGMLNDKLSGYAASIIRAYQKAQEWEAERKEKAEGRKDRGYIGKVGPTQDLGKVRVVRVRYTDGDYGVKTIVALEADIDEKTVAPITWFASGERDFEEGAEYTLRAGVKKHEDDPKWGKQTIITRAKLIRA